MGIFLKEPPLLHKYKFLACEMEEGLDSKFRTTMVLLEKPQDINSEV
jgi:hypothetical protein